MRRITLTIYYNITSVYCYCYHNNNVYLPLSCGSARIDEAIKEPATNRSRTLRAASIAHPATANHAHDVLVHPASHPNAHAGRTCTKNRKNKTEIQNRNCRYEAHTIIVRKILCHIHTIYSIDTLLQWVPVIRP